MCRKSYVQIFIKFYFKFLCLVKIDNNKNGQFIYISLNVREYLLTTEKISVSYQVGCAVYHNMINICHSHSLTD